MIQTIYNEYGEPIGTETVRTQYEEEIAYCEEMDRRAEDPFYAARIEEQDKSGIIRLVLSLKNVVS